MSTDNPTEGLVGEQYLKVFYCHGCQSCWEMVDKGNGDFDTIKHQHILSIEVVTEDIKHLKHRMEGLDK